MPLKSFSPSAFPRLLRQGVLLGLALLPAGIVAGVLRYITYKPLRWLIVWGLEPLLRRVFQRMVTQYQTRRPESR